MARVTRHLELRGVFASAVTPRRKGSADADFSASLELLDFLAEAGMQAICLFGATGEFFDYDYSERQRMVYLGVKRSRVPLLAGVSHPTLAGAIRLATEAINSGADGLFLMPPFFFRYSQPEIEEFYLQFADATGDAVPILLHNLPHLTSAIEIDTVRKLIATGQFAGIKDSSGDLAYFEQLLTLKREHPFALFCGSDRIAAQALRSGADGVISAHACAVPELFAGLTRAIIAGDETRRHILTERLIELLDWSEKFPFPVAIKHAVELRGQKAGPPLIPLAPESLRALDEFTRWFATWLPLTKKAAAHA